MDHDDATHGMGEVFDSFWIAAGIMAVITMVKILYVVANHFNGYVAVHDLKVESHTLTLALKQELAERQYQELQHRRQRRKETEEIVEQQARNAFPDQPVDPKVVADVVADAYPDEVAKAA